MVQRRDLRRLELKFVDVVEFLMEEVVRTFFPSSKKDPPRLEHPDTEVVCKRHGIP